MDNNRDMNPEEIRTLQETARLNAELEKLFSEHPVQAGGSNKTASSDKRVSSGSRYADKQDVGASGSIDDHKSSAKQSVENEESRTNSEGVRVLSQRAVDEKAGKRRRQHRGLRILAGILCVLFLLAAIAAGGLWYLREQGRKKLLVDRPETTITAPEGAEISPDGTYVTYEGRHYKRNEKVVSILVMGVDRKEGDIAKSDELQPGEQGQADTIMVGALDTQTGELKIINISRDSMVDVDIYNVDGEYAGVENMQICLAYAYGDGAHQSCQNVSKSVTRLLYGMPMDLYASIDLPAVNVLNDAVGGVTLDVLEDLSQKDPSLTKGAIVTLNGDQARIYIQSRDHENLDGNNARMARQKQYLVAFLRKIALQVRSNLSTILTLYQAAQTYMTTDIDLSQTAYLASIAFTRNITADTIRTVPGEVTEGEQFAEYHVDDNALYQILLDAYYVETSETGDVQPVTEVYESGVEGQTEQTSGSEAAPIIKDDTQATFQQSGRSQQETELIITIDPDILH